MRGVLEREITGSRQDLPWHPSCTVCLLIMTSITLKSVLLCGLCATALLVGGRAQGQTGGVIGSGTDGTSGGTGGTTTSILSPREFRDVL
jgi:hypothetical protein